MRKLWPPNVNAKNKLPQLICDRVWVIIVVKNPPANAGDPGDAGSIPGLGRFPGVGNGNPLRSSCLGIPQTEEPGKLLLIESQRGGCY